MLTYRYLAAMLGIQIVILLVIFIYVQAADRHQLHEVEKFRDRIATLRQERNQSRQARKTICYDMVGCFPSQRKRSPLKKSPETPETVNTKFWLYTKSNIAEAQLLVYGDNLTSILLSDFNPKQPVKVLIHGFKGSASEKGALTGKNAILKLGDYNVIVVDWKRGAAAAYPVAVANTELVGRQTALLLLDMVAVGTKPANIHLVGFSLGAHIAGCAGFVVQQNGHKLGRITGLDPASPIFRHHIILDTSRKLDPSDADFVDVIHTDGSPVWTNGFGLLRQIGHVDFFPNGGREQPGCNDRRASVVVSHFEGVLDIDIACSHARAWLLFLESLMLQKGGCQFMAYPCIEGLQAFTGGMCFPSHGYCNHTHKDSYHSCGLMGQSANVSPGRGAQYLVTRESAPFCGEQLRATVYLSEKTHRTKGILHMDLQHGSSITKFHIKCEFLETIEGGRKIRGLGAAEYGTIDPSKTPTIKAFLSYQTTVKEEMVSPTLYVDHLEIMDQKGNRWKYCGKEEILEDNATTPKQVPMILKYNTCAT